MPVLRTVFGEHSSILRDPRFQVLVLANLVYPMGTPYISPLLDSLQAPLNATPTNIGLLLTAFYLPTIFVTPFIGALVDRVGRKPVLVTCLLMVGGGGVAIPATTSLAVVLVLRLIQGAGAAGILLSVIASLGEFYVGDEGVTAQGIRMTFHSAGAMVLPVVAGVLIAYGWRIPFLLYGIAIPIAFVVYQAPGLESRSTDSPSASETTSESSVNSSIRDLFHVVRQHHVFATITGMILPGFFLTAFLTYTSIVINDVGGTPSQAGMLIAIFGLASGVAASQSGRLIAWFDRQLTVLTAGNLCLATGLAFLGVAQTVTVLGVAAITVGVGFGLLLSVYRNRLTEIAPAHLRGGLTSFGEVANAVGLTTPPVVMGFVIGYLTPELAELEAVRATIVAVAIAGGFAGVLCATVASSGQSHAEPAGSTTDT